MRLARRHWVALALLFLGAALLVGYLLFMRTPRQ
jgi:hypothetical protein